MRAGSLKKPLLQQVHLRGMAANRLALPHLSLELLSVILLAGACSLESAIPAYAQDAAKEHAPQQVSPQQVSPQQQDDKPLPVPKAVPLPKMPAPGSVSAGSAEPTNPPAQTVADSRTHLSFRLPPGWNVARRDGELSTFHLDAKTAPRKAEVRVAAGLAFNPFPRSTFSGALFYVSVTPHSSAAVCAEQATSRPNEPLNPSAIGGVSFERGHEEHGGICTESRDTVMTALRQGSCLRFDLVITTFCGGEVSGARDITEPQLRKLQDRFESVLSTVQFDGQRH